MENAVKGIALVSVYAVDYLESYKFYTEVLGLVKAFDMGTAACYFQIGENSGLYLNGGNKKNEIDTETVRSSFILEVDNAFELLARLKQLGYKVDREVPVEMAPNQYWFMFYDPSGNIIEILGGK
jgi:predicted enzyme related to lactoylglutathione lyase